MEGRERQGGRDGDLLISVDGQWGVWRSSGQCSQTCGGGTQYQSRSCDSPAPAHGGADCQGDHSQQKQCNTKTCVKVKGKRHWSLHFI